ncbi:MAG: NTP transferase domain-containing protein [Desulfurococcales archaeon]|nr:NTP transferase domain-containing protein [Desulfurococcales archaeon]
MLRGVILAGGASTRYGKLKILQRVSGKPVLLRVIEATREYTGEVLVIASPHTTRDVKRLVEGKAGGYNEVKVLRDENPLPCQGPIRGIVTSLIYVTPWSREDEILVAPGDAPWLTSGSLELIHSFSKRLAAQVAVPVDALGNIYLPFLYVNNSVFREVLSACYLRAGNSRATDVLRVANRLALLGYGLVAGENSLSMVTFNRPEDLEKPQEPKQLNASILVVGGGNLFGEAYRREAMGDRVGAFSLYHEEYALYKSLGLKILEKHVCRDLERIQNSTYACRALMETEL